MAKLVFKHQTHDQKTHGRRGGGGGSTQYTALSGDEKERFRRVLPGGKGRSRFDKNSWTARRGYRGERSVRSAVSKAEAMGFKRVDSKSTNLPDGSWVNTRTQYLHGKTGVVMETEYHYGSTAYDNRFSVYLTFPGEG